MIPGGPWRPEAAAGPRCSATRFRRIGTPVHGLGADEFSGRQQPPIPLQCSIQSRVGHVQSKAWFFTVVCLMLPIGSPLPVGFSAEPAAGPALWQEPESEKPESGTPEAKPQEPETPPKKEGEQEPAEKPETSGEQDPEKMKGEEAPEKTEDGSEDLDRAFTLKLEARTTKDLEEVARLCESALEKGLDDKDAARAKQLAAASLFEFADQLGNRIFTSDGRDRRWQLYRAQALPRLAKAIEFDPGRVDAHILSAKLQALPGGDRVAAQAAVEKAIELAVDDRRQLSEALFIRASLASDEGARLADLNQSIKIYPENVQARQVRAAYFLGKGEPEKALEDYRAWLSNEPENYQARVIVANGLIGTGEKFDESLQKAALELLEEAIEIKPDFSVPFTVKARIHIIAEQDEAAIEAASKAIELEPKNIEARRLRATALAEQAKYDEALEDAEEIIKLQGFSPDGIQLRGAIRIQQGEFGKAIEDFRALSEMNPNNRPLKRQLAALYNANDEPSKAIEIYSELIRFTDESTWADRPAPVKALLMNERAELLRGRGDARLSRGEHKQAVDDYEEALKLGEQVRELQESEGMELSVPDDGVLNNLAWVLATSPKDEVRNGKRAIELATQAAEVTEYKEAHILSTLASGYAETGDFDKAIELIEQALEINRAEGEKAADKTATDKQFKSLNKELDSYREKKPWRELQDVENEAASQEPAGDDSPAGNSEEKSDSAPESKSGEGDARP